MRFELDFKIDNLNKKIKIFTTRPDTIFGASFIAVSVDHEICKNFVNDQDFKKLALQTLPKDRFDKNTWSVWTNSLMKESGKKGKELFKPLRLCLTGQSNGPEMANLVLMMGKDKIKERLNNNN